MEHLGQSNADHVNLSRLKQRVLELEQSNNILLTEKEQFQQEVTKNILDKNNIELSHHNDLLQMQLNEEKQRTKILSATFTATNSEMDKESQLNAHLQQSVKSQQVTIAKLRKERKQMTSTNQSLSKQLEETNAKYDKLQNEYDSVTKDDTQYINQLEYEIDELRKRITSETQRAPSPLEQSSDTLPDAEDQKTEDILEGGARVGPHFPRRTQVLSSIPSLSSITSNSSSIGPAFNNITSPRKQIYQPLPNRMSVVGGRPRSESAKLPTAQYVGPKFSNAQSVPLDVDNAGDDVDSVIYVDHRRSARSGSVFSELLRDDELYDDEWKEQYNGFNENNTNPSGNYDPLQMQLHEAEIRTLEQQEMIAKLQKEQEQMKSKNHSLAKQLDETNAKYDKLQNEYSSILENKPVPPTLEESSDAFPNAEDQKTEDMPITQFGESIQRVQPLSSLSGNSLPTLKSKSLHSRSTTKESHELLPPIQTYLGNNASATYGRFSHDSKSNSGSGFVFITESPSSPPRLPHLKCTLENELGDSKSFRYGEYLEYWRKGYSNSVSPKYKDLREELTENNVAPITMEKYEELLSKAQKLLTKTPLIAKRVGNNNPNCGIEVGSSPSLEHIVALLIYTDFTYHQCEFKKQCRRLSANEPLHELVRRNSEIYHWCKLIKELCIFYGEIMGENAVLYSGMREFLMFDSLCTRFECSISTSTKLDVAKRFAMGAIVLKLKRGSVHTKTLDVTKYSCFGQDEFERLVAGSTLQIVDILINNQSQRSYVSALRMLEQIMNGHFIDGDDKIVSKLTSLLRDTVHFPTLTDKLRNLNLLDSFYDFLKDESYDSDSTIEDIVEETSSGIFARFGSSVFAKVRKCCSDHAGTRCLTLIPSKTYQHLVLKQHTATKHPEYIQAIVFCFLRKMQRLSSEGALWLNRRELAQLKYANLHNALVGYNEIFEHFQIGFNDIRDIQTFSWKNSNESCAKRRYLNETEFYTESKEYIYEFDQIDDSVHFQLQFYRKFIGKEIECSIYVKILPKTFGIESVTTEMDIICHCDGKVHRSLMRKQKLVTDTKKGVMVFRSENVNENSSITWKFAIQMEPKQSQSKIKHIRRFPVWERSLDTIDDQEFDDELKEEYDALKENNDALQNEYDTLKESMMEFIKKNERTEMELEEMRMELKDTKMGKEEEIERLREQLRQNGGRVQSRISFFEGFKRSSISNTLAPNEPKKSRWRSNSANFMFGKKDRNE